MDSFTSALNSSSWTNLIKDFAKDEVGLPSALLFKEEPTPQLQTLPHVSQSSEKILSVSQAKIDSLPSTLKTLADVDPAVLSAHFPQLLNPAFVQQLTGQTQSATSEAQPLSGSKRNRVKRPMNSFLLFSNEMRPILQSQNKDLLNAQISKLLGTQWKNLPLEQKKSYIERAAKIKTEFTAAHPDYVYTKTPRKHKKRKLATESDFDSVETPSQQSPVPSASPQLPSQLSSQLQTQLPPQLSTQLSIQLPPQLSAQLQLSSAPAATISPAFIAGQSYPPALPECDDEDDYESGLKAYDFPGLELSEKSSAAASLLYEDFVNLDAVNLPEDDFSAYLQSLK